MNRIEIAQSSSSHAENSSDEVRALHHLVPQFEQEKLEGILAKLDQIGEQERQTLVEKGNALLKEQCFNEALDETHPLAINATLFAHIQADTFGRGTEFEGNHFTTTIPHLRAIIKKLNPFPKLSDLDSVLEKSEQIAGWIRDSKDQSIIEIARRLKNTLMSLAVGKRLLIPSGYFSHTSGHAVLIEFTRVDAKHFKLHLFNTGAGVQFHDRMFQRGKFLGRPHIQLINIKADAERLERFFRVLIECINPSFNIPRNCKIDDAYLYGRVLPMLKGKVAPADSSTVSMMTLQSAGFCTERALHAYLRFRCLEVEDDLETYKAFKLALKKQTLIHFFVMCQKEDSLHLPNHRILLTKGLFCLARAVQKMQGDHDELLAILEAVREAMFQAQKRAFSGKESVQPTLIQSQPLQVPLNDWPNDQKQAGEVEIDVTARRTFAFAKERPDLDAISWEKCFSYFESLIPDPTQKEIPREHLVEVVQFFQVAAPKLLKLQTKGALIQKFSWIAAFAEVRLMHIETRVLSLKSLILHYTLLLIHFEIAQGDSNNCLEGYCLDISYFERLLQAPHLHFVEKHRVDVVRKIMLYFKQSRLDKKSLDLADEQIYFELKPDPHQSVTSKFYQKLLPKNVSGKEFLMKTKELVVDEIGLPEGVSALRQHHMLCLQMQNFLQQGAYKDLEEKFTYEMSSERKDSICLKHRIEIVPEWKWVQNGLYDHYPALKTEPIIGTRNFRVDLIKVQNFGPMNGIILENGIEEKEKNYLSVYERKTENQVVVNKKKEPYTHDVLRDLRSLIVNRPLLPFNATAYFSKHLEKLNDPKMQEFFMHCLFKTDYAQKLNYFDRSSSSPSKVIYEFPWKSQDDYASYRSISTDPLDSIEYFRMQCYLQEVVKKDHSIVTELVQLIQKGIVYFEALEELHPCLFLAHLGQRLQAYFEKGDFPERIPLLKKWLPLTKTTDERSLVFYHLLGAYACKENREVHDLIRAHFYLGVYPLKTKDLFPSLVEDVDKVYYRFFHQPQFWEEIEDVEDLCTIIAEDLFQTKQVVKWERKGTVFHGDVQLGEEFGRCSLDLESAKMELDHHSVQQLPHTVRENWLTKELLCEYAFVSEKVDTNTYVMQVTVNATIVNLRVLMPSKYSIDYYLSMDQKWWKWCPRYKLTNSMKHKGIFTSKSMYIWVCGGDGMVTDGQFQILFRFKVENEMLVSFVRESDQHQLVPCEVVKKHFSYLGLFETSEYTHLWNQTDGDLGSGKLEFPNYNLNFLITSRNDHHWIESQRYRGYQLIDSGIWQGLGEKTSCLLLENPSGQRKVLLPRLPFKAEKEQFGLMAVPDLSITRSPFRYFACDVTPEGNLKGDSREAKLFLIYLYLSKGQDPTLRQKGEEIFKQLHQMQPLAPSELELIVWAITRPETKHGDAHVCRLAIQLALYVEENWKIFPESVVPLEKPNEYYSGLSQRFDLYLDLHARVPKRHLAREEEQVIIEVLKQEKCLSAKAERWITISSQERSGLSSGVSCAVDGLKLTAWQWQDAILNRLVLDHHGWSLTKNRWHSREAVLASRFTFAPFDFKYHFKVLYEMILNGEQDYVEDLLQVIQMNHREDIDILFAGYLNCLIIHGHSGLGKTVPPLETVKEDYQNVASHELRGFFRALHRLYARHVIQDRNQAQRKKISYSIVDNGAVSTVNDKRIIESSSQRLLRTQENVHLPKASALREEMEPFYQIQQVEKILNQVEFKVHGDSKYIEDMNLDLLRYREKLANGTEVIITQPDGLKDAIRKVFEAEKKHLKIYKNQLLMLANRLPEERVNRIVTRLELLGCQREKIPFRQLVGLYLLGNRPLFKEKNPHLTDGEITALMQGMTRYLDRAILQTKRERTLKNGLSQETVVQRQYGTEKPPERIRAYQVFEYLTEMQIRPNQMQMIENILEGKVDGNEREFVAQLIMGGGKSKVILPLLALLMANGENLVLIMVPKALLQTQKKYMADITGGLFDQEGNTFDFDRQTQFSVERLERLLARLKSVMKRGEYLIVTPETMQSLELRYIECLATIKELGQIEDLELVRKKELLGECLRLFRQKGGAILDEADSILDPRHELNYTLGEGVPLPSDQLDLVTKMYRLLVCNEELASLLGIRENRQASRVDEHLTDVKALLAKKLAVDFSDENDRASLIGYLLNDPEMKEIPVCVRNLGLQQKDQVAIIREQLATYLPLTLSKIGHQDYAFSKDWKIPFAIPAHSSQPMEGAQFGNAFEALNYTLQLYLQVGVRKEQLEGYIMRLQAKAHEEMKKGIPFFETNVYASFNQIYPAKSLFAIKEKDWPDIADAINQNEEALFQFVRDGVLPEIHLHLKKMTSDPWRLVAMFQKVYGFTGTPWNDCAFHPRLGQAVLDQGVDGFTMQLLADKKGAIIEMRMPETKGADPLVRAVLQKVKDPLALIDTGALFKGIPNLDVAKAFLKELETSGIRGVVFFHHDNLAVLEKGRVYPIPYSESCLEPGERFTYYDDAHTIGADIPQAPHALAVLTVGENLFHKDLLQSSWRMRGLDKQQSLVFLAIDETLGLIAKSLSKELDQLDVADLFTFSGRNQAGRQEEDALRAANQMITATLRDRALQAILDHEQVAPEYAQAVYQLFDHNGIFVTQLTHAPFAQCGGMKTIEAAEEQINRNRKEWFDQMEQFEVSTPLVAADLIKISSLKNQALSDLKGLKNPEDGRIPAMVPKPSVDDLGTEIEIQSRVREEAETRIELQVEMDEKIQEEMLPQKVVWTCHHLNRYAQKRLSPTETTMSGLKSLMKKDLVLSAFAETFSNEQVMIKVTNNWFRFTQERGEQKSIWFERRHKPINHVFVCMEEKECFLTLISEDDAIEIAEQLFQLKKSPHVKRYALYDMRLEQAHLCNDQTLIMQGLERKEVKEALLKLKVLNGEVNFTEWETQFLSEWILQVGVEAFITVVGKILQHRDTREQFTGSDLEQAIFKAKGQLSLENKALKQKEQMARITALQQRRQELELSDSDDKELEIDRINQAIQSILRPETTLKK